MAVNFGPRHRSTQVVRACGEAGPGNLSTPLFILIIRIRLQVCILPRKPKRCNKKPLRCHVERKEMFTTYLRLKRRHSKTSATQDSLPAHELVMFHFPDFSESYRFNFLSVDAYVTHQCPVLKQLFTVTCDDVSHVTFYTNFDLADVATQNGAGCSYFKR